MTFYPIFRRELVRAMRRPVLYWLRLGTVLMAVIVGLYLLWGGGSWQASSALGLEIFQRVTWPAFVVCLLSGILLTSNLLCDERREGSLALLFLTRLNGFDVVLGKLLAVGLLTAQIVLAVLPVLALSMVLGGVSGAEFARMVQVLLSTIALSFAIGILVSALNRSMGRAALITFFVLGALTAGLALADAKARRYLPLDPTALVVPGPLQLFLTVPDLQFRLPPLGFRNALLWQCAFAMGLLLLAASMLKRLSISGEGVRGAGATLRDCAAGWRRRRNLLRRNPIYWMVLRSPGRRRVTFVLFGVLVSAWFAFLYYFREEEWCMPWGFFLLGPLLHLLFKIVVISEASEFFATARRGELELLLVSPLSSSKIILGHSRALFRQFLWPAGLIFAADLFLVFFHKPPIPHAQNATAYLFVFALGITLVVDLPALIWRGLWNGLRSRNGLSAMRRTFAEVLLLPLLFYLGALAVMAWVFMVLFQLVGMREPEGAVPAITMIVLWWLVSFVLGFLFERNARQNLSTWLRFVAANGGTGAHLRQRFLTVPSRVLPYIQAAR